jgi:hypothetical protein
VRPGLALGDDLAQELLERLHVVVLEHADARAREPDADTDRGVVELVGDDEAALADERRDDGRVGREAHGHDGRVLLADEIGDERLGLLVEVECAALQPGSARADAIPLDALLDDVGAAAASLSETKVVVRRDVEGAGPSAGEGQRFVVILAVPVEEHDRPASDTGDGLAETVVDTSLEPAGIERVEVRVQRSVTLARSSAEAHATVNTGGTTHIMGHEMAVFRTLCTLAEEVADVTDHD